MSFAEEIVDALAEPVPDFIWSYFTKVDSPESPGVAAAKALSAVHRIDCRNRRGLIGADGAEAKP